MSKFQIQHLERYYPGQVYMKGDRLVFPSYLNRNKGFERNRLIIILVLLGLFLGGLVWWNDFPEELARIHLYFYLIVSIPMLVKGFGRSYEIDLLHSNFEVKYFGRTLKKIPMRRFLRVECIDIHSQEEYMHTRVEIVFTRGLSRRIGKFGDRASASFLAKSVESVAEEANNPLKPEFFN
ncbi:MAG: hypothetical protein MRZ79_03280 [Bacteroidia bacterium]|nr:hypothetical protein [Bacteroidia bacterium]